MTLLPECLDDFIGPDNPVRVVDAFVEALDLSDLGFDGVAPAATGRPSYHPAVLLKIYIYGYLNRVQSSRRLEHECQRNVELMWLTGRLAPDFKTIADFRRDSGKAIRNACRQFVTLCRQLKLFSQAAVAIDGSKFKAVNSRERNYTEGKIDRRQRELEANIQRYLDAMDTADRTLPQDWLVKTARLGVKIEELNIAYQNKAALYGLLFDIAAETLLRIAADPKHLGACIGATLVLHTWGSALTHHPHVHGIVPGGGLAPDGTRWIACRPGFFLPVRVLSRLFRRRFLEELQRLHDGGKLRFFGEHAVLAEPAAFKAWLAPLRQCEWVVYAKRPFAGPQAVLAYLSRYTHRVAISNSRLLAMDERGVTFRWKDYRAKGKTRHKAMTLSPQEFMRRFLLHVLPGGFHRIRHYGLLSNSNRRDHLALARELLHVTPPPPDESADDASTAPAPTFVCAHCGRAMVVLQVFLRDCSIRAPPAS